MSIYAGSGTDVSGTFVLRPILGSRAGLQGILQEVRPMASRLPASTRFEVLRSAFRILCLAAFLTACLGDAAYCQMGTLPSAWQQKEFPGVVWRLDRTPPKIDNGYVVSFRQNLKNGPQGDSIHLNSLATSQESQVSFWLPGASSVWINDVAVSSNQRLIVVGAFAQAADGTARNFLAETDLTGRLVNTIDMGSYEPGVVCTEKDGSIWMIGQDRGAPAAGHSYPILSNYSEDGHLLRSYLTNQDFPFVQLNLSARLRDLGGTPGRVFIQCGSQYVGAYIGPARSWVQVRLSDGTGQRWRVRIPVQGASVITGLAWLGGTVVYGSFRTGPDNSDSAGNGVIVRGLYKLDLSLPGTAIWKPMTTSPDALGLSFGAVVGEDSDSLVYIKLSSAPTKIVSSGPKMPILFWAKM